MDHHQLIDLTRRALKLARDQTTDLAPRQHTVHAREYTSLERHERDRAMLMSSPQLVGYVSELPRPGSYCTKTVLGRSVLLTRTSDGSVRAFDNVCLHRQAQVATGCGTAKRFSCPYHAWTYDNSGRLVGLPGREGFPEMTLKDDGLTRLPATEFAGFLWVALDPGATLDIATHLGPLAGELDSWGIGHWSPLGEKVLDSRINWKLAIDTFSENYHFATVHKQTFATIARSNCTVFDSYGPHHRLIFPLNTIMELDTAPEDQWNPFHHMVVIYALFPNIVLSVTIANGELFRVYPGEKPGRSVTVHQNSTALDISDDSVATGAQAVFEYAHATVRDEDYRLAESLQANLESGARERLVFGRNEPGLQHRHLAWERALDALRRG
ncbi:aromatic ring-hydroxylating oxygenase subunit alpha [Mycobacterium kansasii]|uniref:Rieske domain protein n=4 Tax=Mycobacterium kansasii TaxID=1768 RepID=A0A1V3XLE1_MYCKA|nr:SRPBCC family protein [Mycobacterium kansasii]EUA01832.1 rieske domain protein [Mycobacterium kansasii 824]AGZ49840.1 (2Fe-2S)-binding protein [Mycobacterium kansasii ATCC 12478]ARG58270.1 (2Fe-2S)-binding protein [Mycobacterium kansasii]ARG63784.1 (2Fe-2S)-binding protein [Mycobacterium kansasii]ARG71429.1 (2Fe-2S)-binding protein [Mycobacterium kansasii]